MTVKELVSGDFKPGGMDINYNTEHIYFTCSTTGKVYRVLSDGSGLETLVDSIADSYDVALDMHTNTMYVSSPADGIYAADLRTGAGVAAQAGLIQTQRQPSGH